MSLCQVAALQSAETTGSSLLATCSVDLPSAMTHNHVAFQADLQNMSLLCISQQLFWDPAVTNQICLSGLAEPSYS